MRVRSYGALPTSAADFALKTIAGFYDRIEVKSTLTPPVSYSMADLQDQSPPSWITQFAKPTLILSGPAGQKIIAPYGEAEGGTTGLVVLFTVIFGLGFATAWLVK